MTPGRLGAATVAVLALIAALFVVAGPPAPAEAAMCGPTTLDDLPPLPGTPRPRTPSTTSTTTPGTSTPTTVPGDETTTTTAVETTTTTVTETSTTTIDDSTSTTVDGDASTSLPGPSPTSPPRPSRPRCSAFVYDMAWPIAGDSPVISTFGVARDGGARRHAGIDLGAPKLTPVLAVSDGTVLEIKQVVGTEDCCSIKIRHDDGWYSVYIHLNNDLHLTDDGMGIGARPDLKVGDAVVAGQVIGWIGDSGNAEDSVNHLHFELRTRQGVAVDPAASLRQARREAEIPDPAASGPYLDDDGDGIQLQAALLLTQGLYLPCDEIGLTLCPEELADPEFARAVARHLVGVEPPPMEARTQEIPQVFVAAAGDARALSELMGCVETEPCLAFGIPETEVARLAAWALSKPQPADLTSPELVNTVGALGVLPDADEAETLLRNAGVLGECRPPLDDQRLINRGEALANLLRWIHGPTIADCADVTQPVR